MSNERPHEFLSWRVRLTEFEALPGQGLDDKEASWQRLSERLRKGPRRRGFAWWMAAACLVLAFFIPGHLSIPDRIAVHDPVPPKSQSRHQPVASSRTYGEFDETKSKTHRQTRAAARAPLTPTVAGLAAPTSVPIRPVAAFTDSLLASAPPLPAVIPPPQAHASAAKHPLRVVCYNEIMSPASPPPQTALRETAVRKFVRGRLPYLGSTDPASRSNDGPLLTINLLSKNN